MRLLKPSWVSHDGRPIFSVDIHPDGSRFATGGQGDDCGKVAIWNMGPLKVEEEELNTEIPRLLCQMDNHLACVNCVRWSNDGKYLASGGDDNLVMVWQMARYTTPMTTFGSGGGKLNIEQWRCVHTLRQHDGDVLDLSWSPDDSFLASASVDNTITIWNAERFPEVLQVLKGHTGLVKGVTWDPVGKYLASQADDKTLRVWRTSDWQQEASVTEPFLECSGTTHVLRLSWSPDGHYVVSAHAMNNSGPVAKILERDGWKTRMDFVGHRKAITCVRFNPKLFVKKVNGDSSRLKQYSCCAIGCRDRSLSIWLTSLKRPLVVVHDLFNHSVMDMSWSQTGFELLVCSWDGTVAYADFSSDELGKAMSQQEKEKFHKQVYGISISNSKTKLASSIIENPEMLKIQQRHQMKQQTQASVPKPAIPPPPLVPTGTPTGNLPKQENSQLSNGLSSSSKSIFTSPSYSMNINVKEQQKETITKDGRRRITPVLVAQMDVNDTPQPFGSSQSTPAQPPQTASALSSADFTIPTSQSLSALHSRIGEQATTGFKDSSIITTKAPIPSVKATQKSPAKTLSTNQTSSPSKQASGSTTSSTSVSVSVKRKGDTGPTTSKRMRKEKEHASRNVSTSSRHREDRTEPEETITASVSTRHTVCIPFPTPEKTLTVQISCGRSDGDVTLELENNLSSSDNAVHVLTCSSAGKVTWDAMVTSPGIALAGNRNVVCVACLNKTLNIFSFGGTRLMPALVLDAAASMLQCNGFYVMVVTSSGGVYVWDTKKRSVIVKNESALAILSGSDVTISRASISDRGYPVITLSTQSSYSFEPEFGTWIQLVRAEDPLTLNADYKSTLARQDPFEVRGPLSKLQSTRLSHQGGRLFRSNPGRQQTATVSHLENQLAACLALGSGNEYHFWLMTYVRYLVQAGFESRLREICSEFLGPPYRSNTPSKQTGWSPRILSYNKKDLLREILQVIGTNIRLQRLFTEFKDQLDASDLRT